MSPVILFATVAALATLGSASVRRIPEGQVYALRRPGGHMRLLGAGIHFILPLIERVAHKVSLAGSAVTVDTDGLPRAVVYFQLLDPARAGSAIGAVPTLVANRTRQLLREEQPAAGNAARLKQRLNEALHDSGLLVARVDLRPVS